MPGVLELIGVVVVFAGNESHKPMGWESLRFSGCCFINDQQAAIEIKIPATVSCAGKIKNKPGNGVCDGTIKNVYTEHYRKNKPDW